MAGQTIAYTITVLNAGPSTANDVVVDDPPPADLAFVSNSGACTTAFPLRPGHGRAGRPAGDHVDVHGAAGQRRGARHGQHGDPVELHPDPNPEDETSSVETVIAASADLALVKTGSPSGSVGQPVVYTLRITSAGPDPAVDAVMTDTVPAGSDLGVRHHDAGLVRARLALTHRRTSSYSRGP